MLEQTKATRILVLKPRQKGITSYISADQLIDCLRKPTNAMIISHEKEATKRIFGKVKYFIDNLEVKPAIKYETKQDIFFPKTNSNYYIGTEGQKTVGRGDTIHRALLSEVAHFMNAKKVIGAVSEAMPIDNSKMFAETTANGRGEWFYDEWQKAKAGESVWIPLFFPWFIDEEYRLGEEDLIKLGIPEEVRMKINDQKIGEEEAELAKKYNLSFDQIRWRRYKLWDLGELFFQEYPEDDVSCFLQSGRPVFKHVKMTNRPELDKDKNYLGGLDGAEGILGGDNHSFALIDQTPPMKVAFEITSNEPIDIFDQRVKEIMEKYPKIKLGIEKNGVGKAHCEKFKEWGIPFIEWETTNATRPIMIVELEEAYRKEELLETYLEAKNELLDMFYDDANKPTHREGKHDDRVFARAIAWQMRKQPEIRIRWI